MTNGTQLRFSMEAALGVMSVVVLLLTLTMPDWIERTFGLEPDGGDARTEWQLAISLIVAAFILCADAWRLWSQAFRIRESS